MTPTKDKKLKPVMHVLATDGSGNIIAIYPDKCHMKLSDMLKSAIEHLFPSGQENLRA